MVNPGPDTSGNNENNASSSPHGRLDDNDEPHAPDDLKNESMTPCGAAADGEDDTHRCVGLASNVCCN